MLKLHLFQGACVVPFAEDTATSCASSETQREREEVLKAEKTQSPCQTCRFFGHEGAFVDVLCFLSRSAGYLEELEVMITVCDDGFD